MDATETYSLITMILAGIMFLMFLFWTFWTLGIFIYPTKFDGLRRIQALLKPEGKSSDRASTSQDDSPRQ